MIARWNRLQELAWGGWVGYALIVAVAGERLGYGHLIALIVAFGVFEGIGLWRRRDSLPTLTEEIHRRLPGWFAFPVLAVGLWRLLEVVPDSLDFAVVALGAWLLGWHLDRTYDEDG